MYWRGEKNSFLLVWDMLDHLNLLRYVTALIYALKKRGGLNMEDVD